MLDIPGLSQRKITFRRGYPMFRPQFLIIELNYRKI